MSRTLRVAFLFASRGVGGAEQTMLRLMAATHPHTLRCSLIVPAPENPAFRRAAAERGVPYFALSPGDGPALGRVLQAEAPDVVYMFGRIRTIPWAMIARSAGVGVVVAAERSTADRPSDALARRLDRYLVDAYIANSYAAAERLRRRVGDKPVWVIPNGIDAAPARDGAGPADPRAPLLLCLARIDPNKGQGVLLEAVRLLRGRGWPGAHAVLLGRDDTGGRFFADAAGRGLADTYVAPGFVPEVEPYLAKASVVVLPTLRREGLPTALLEAMRAGVPVVASRVGGVPEVVDDEGNGLLVPPGDPGALAGAIGRLLEDEALRSRLTAAAGERVRGRHSVAAMVEGHRRAFAALVGRKSPAASVAHVTTAALSLRYLLLNQLAAIQERGFSVAGVSSPGADVAVLEARGMPHHPVPMTRRITPFADLRSILRLYRLMKRERFAVVHTHNPKPGLLAQLAARLAGVPVVVNTLHGFYFHDGMSRLQRRFFIWMERIAARCSDVVLSQSPEDVETAIREGIVRPDRIRCLGNGIDLRRFDPAAVTEAGRRRVRRELGIADGERVVGFVGRLVAEKGLLELFAAMARIRDRVPVRLLLVGGDDPEKPDGIGLAEARRLGVADLCIFAGVRQDMPALYGAMDVFVLPSHREGFPRAPMEASAMGVPCVVTDIRGCRQVVTSGRNGFLVPVKSPAALAEAVLRILQDDVLARRLGSEGHRRALEEFDERRVFASVLAEYERLLQAKGLGGRIPAPLLDPHASRSLVTG